MRMICILVIWSSFCSQGFSETTGRILKVLPQLLDKQGRNSRTPSLYDRDSYQFYLRLHPAEISALQFAVQWKTAAASSDVLKLRVEIRGAATNLPAGKLPEMPTIEQPLHPRSKWSHWAYLKLPADVYKSLGDVTAWRVTLWNGDALVSEQKSFLW